MASDDDKKLWDAFRVAAHEASIHTAFAAADLVATLATVSAASATMAESIRTSVRMLERLEVGR